jgi:hypothetical protein
VHELQQLVAALNNELRQLTQHAERLAQEGRMILKQRMTAQHQLNTLQVRCVS